MGPLPQKLGNLTPGEHTLRFAGTERYKDITRTVNVLPNKLENLGSIALPVAKGRATFETDEQGVRMRLVPADGEPRSIEEGQSSVDLDPSKQWKLQACKPGHDLFETPVSFEDGKAEKTFQLELSGDGEDLPDWCGGEQKGPAGPASPVAPKPGAGAAGNVSFNSIPPGAAVLLDGRPVGRTPLAGISVPAGSHSVVFIHPEKGRKSAGVTVKPGQRTGVGVRF